MLVHLLKLQIDPNSPSVERWFEEVLKFHADAVLTLSPSIKQPLDVDKIWRLDPPRCHRQQPPDRLRSARRHLQVEGLPRRGEIPCLPARSAVLAPASCSFSTAMIYSSVNRFRFICPSFVRADSNFSWTNFLGAGQAWTGGDVPCFRRGRGSRAVTVNWFDGTRNSIGPNARDSGFA
jgi:hypothetical protein